MRDPGVASFLACTVLRSVKVLRIWSDVAKKSTLLLWLYRSLYPLCLVDMIHLHPVGRNSPLVGKPQRDVTTPCQEERSRCTEQQRRERAARHRRDPQDPLGLLPDIGMASPVHVPLYNMTIFRGTRLVLVSHCHPLALFRASNFYQELFKHYPVNIGLVIARVRVTSVAYRWLGWGYLLLSRVSHYWWSCPLAA